MAILFSTFISADNGNKADRHIVRMETVTHAFDQALRGNGTYMIEGMQYANKMKSAICKAYSAGFVAVGVISRFDYKGKVTPEIASAIAGKAKELADVFSKAFAEVYPIEDIQKTDEEKAKAKAEAADKKAKAAEAWAKENGFIKASDAIPMADLSASDVVRLVAENVGKLSSSDVARLVAMLTYQGTEAATVEAADNAEAAEADKANTSADRKAAEERAKALEQKAAKEMAEAWTVAIVDNAAFDERKAAEAKAKADAIKAERAAKRQMQKAAKELAEAKAKADAEGTLVTL